MRRVVLEIRPGTPLWRELSSRGKNWNSIIYRDLLRYYNILQDASPSFSWVDKELELLREALHYINLASITDRGKAVARIGEVIESMRLDDKYQVDRSGVLRHLNNMPLSDLMAFLDQEERAQRRDTERHRHETSVVDVEDSG